MKDLKSFAEYLKANRLRELSIEYLRMIKSMDIPLVKRVIEKNLYPGLTEEKSIEMTMDGLGKFLVSLYEGTVFEDVRKSLKQWEEDKLPGISKHDIQPSDLVLIYVAQKKAILFFLPEYTSDTDVAISIVTELEDVYMKVQTDAIQMLFKMQKDIEQRLTESEERFRLIVQNVRDFAFFMLDTEGNIKSWNEGAERIKGYTEEEIIGKHFSVFYTPEDITKDLPEHNLEMTRKLGHYETEGIRVRKDGSGFWANVVFTALYDKSGKLKGFSKLTRDITEIKRAKEELERKTEELVRSNTELEQFAYVASHDLQEPLRTVSSYLQLLASRYKGKLDEDANEFIDFAVDGSNRMRQLINSLLEFSRINRVKPFEKMDLNDILADILMDLNETIISTGAKITHTNLPELYGDPVLIGQLFQNLISNALKFRSNKRPEIDISCERKNGQFLFAVKDNGIGMEKEYWDKIFVIFQRLNSREKYPGTGIGLSICKKIVERHGGKIWVASEINKGSTFYFTINRHIGIQLRTAINENAKKDKHIIS